MWHDLVLTTAGTRVIPDPSLTRFICAELTRGYFLEHNEAKYTERRERVYTCMRIPKELEKVAWPDLWSTFTSFVSLKLTRDVYRPQAYCSVKACSYMICISVGLLISEYVYCINEKTCPFIWGSLCCCTVVWLKTNIGFEDLVSNPQGFCWSHYICEYVVVTDFC